MTKIKIIGYTEDTEFLICEINGEVKYFMECKNG